MKKYIKAAFSTTIPSWLKKSLTGGRLNNYHNAVLRDGFAKKGIALDRAQFLDHDPGVGSQPIYLLQTDYGTRVYAPGINDDSTGYFNNRQRKFGSIAKSKLPGMAADVVWVDMTDPSSTFEKKESYRDPRYTYRHSSRGDYAGQYRTQEYLGNGEYKYTGWSKKGMHPSNESRARDKSGYRIPSPEEMITRFYEKYPEKLTDKVDVIYQEILDAREEIFAYNFKSLDEEDRYSSRVENAYRYLGSAIGDYRNMLSSLRDVQKWAENGYELDSYTLRRFSNTITSIRSHLREAIELLYPTK